MYGFAVCKGIDAEPEVIHRNNYESQKDFILRVAEEYSCWLTPSANKQCIVTIEFVMEG